MKCDRPGRTRVARCDAMVSRQARLRSLGVCAGLFAASWAFSANAAVCYANAAASGGNGSSWAAAYKDLQSALNNAACNEVWVAQGVYKPVVPVNVGSPTNAERAITFNIKPGVAVYGGFAGGETSRAAADPVAHATILSGDIDNNDDANNADGNFVDETSADIAGKNSIHVVIMDGTTGTPIASNTVLDGFTLTGGDNTVIDTNNGGGALLCKGNGSGHQCSPTLARLRILGNKAVFGGGIALNGYSDGDSSPTLTQVYFGGNFATTLGGGLHNNGQLGGASSPLLRSVTFSANSASSYGGAIENNGVSPTLINVTFSGNSASLGGAVHNNGNGSGNHASPTLLNATFSGNSAAYGGAMYNAANSGGASNPVMYNVVLWGDSASQADPEIGGSGNSGLDYMTTIYYGIEQGGCQGAQSCSNVLAGDPLLGTLDDHGGFVPTFMPGTGSSAINSVPCYLTPYTDARDAPRPDPASADLATACDMGAVEVASLAGDSIYVDGFGALQYR